MSLKNLVNKVRKSQIKSNTPLDKFDDQKAFSGLDYNLHLKSPTDAELLSLLEGFTSIIKSNPNGLTDKQKKAFILAFYRLAFAQESRAKGVFHPSEIAQEDNMCRRKMYFQLGRVPVDATYVNFTSDNRMMRLVDLGTLVHLYIQENLDRLGVLKDFEVPVSSPKYGIEGKMDGIIEFIGNDDYGKYYDAEDMVLEIKTINDYGFKALRRPKPEHIRQASIYGYFLGLKRICFVYYNKNNSDLKIYVVDIDFAYVEDFKLLAKGVIQNYNGELRSTRTKDVSKHVNIPKKVCRNRTSKRAMECAFADYCFKHQSK